MLNGSKLGARLIAKYHQHNLYHQLQRPYPSSASAQRWAAPNRFRHTTCWSANNDETTTANGTSNLTRAMSSLEPMQQPHKQSYDLTVPKKDATTHAAKPDSLSSTPQYNQSSPPFEKEKKILLLLLNSNQKGTGNKRADQKKLAQIMSVAESLTRQEKLEVDPVYVTELFKLTAQCLVAFDPAKGFLGARKLFWNVIDHKNKYLSDSVAVYDNSANICAMFHSLCQNAFSEERVHTLARVVDAMEIMAFAKSKFILDTVAAHDMLKYFNMTRQTSRALFLLNYMVEQAKKGNLLAKPNLFSFNCVLELCDAGTAINIIQDMVKLSQEVSGAQFPKPNSVSVLLVLGAIAQQPYPMAGARAEKFLMMALEAHEQGRMHLSNIHMVSASAHVLKAWSVSDSPDSGPRTDLLLQRVIDTFKAKGQKQKGPKLDNRIFESNAAAWIKSSKYLKSEDDPLHKRLFGVIDRMESFGRQHGWNPEKYHLFYWRTLETLEAEIHFSGSNEHLKGMLEAIVKRIRSSAPEILSPYFVQRFQIPRHWLVQAQGPQTPGRSAFSKQEKAERNPSVGRTALDRNRNATETTSEAPNHNRNASETTSGQQKRSTEPSDRIDNPPQNQEESQTSALTDLDFGVGNVRVELVGRVGNQISESSTKSSFGLEFRGSTRVLELQHFTGNVHVVSGQPSQEILFPKEANIKCTLGNVTVALTSIPDTRGGENGVNVKMDGAASTIINMQDFTGNLKFRLSAATIPETARTPL